MATSKRNLPEANILMNSMRAMGYTFESAVADVIDNSICAGAQNIKILMPLSPLEKDVCIFDDGSGMSPAELMEAMKYGSNVPDRKSNDLGRFGLGLKSASLSQCRKLTVVSKKDNIVSALQWDLDFVEKKKRLGREGVIRSRNPKPASYRPHSRYKTWDGGYLERFRHAGYDQRINIYMPQQTNSTALHPPVVDFSQIPPGRGN